MAGRKEGCRTPFGIRTAQSSRFESRSTLSQLNVSLSRVSMRGWKPFGVGGALKLSQKGLVSLAGPENGVRDSTSRGP